MPLGFTSWDIFLLEAEGNGCTWGGSAIKQDIVAALGLRLEFGNSVRTARIREVRVILAEAQLSFN
jgi:hypothetical protein